VTAFTAADIEATGIERVQDFIYQTPGVSLVANTAEVGDTQVNIRGINGTRDAETNYALIIDGILMTNPAALNREYINLQQIEVLKGPQGAIYGRNAAAGAFIITTEKPGDEWGGQVKASFAEDSTEVFSGIFDGPVSDTLGVSVSGSFRDTDGYYNNAYFSSPRYLGAPGSAPDPSNVDQFKSWDMAGRAIWEPSDNLTVDAKLRFGQVDASSIAFNSVFQIPSLVPTLEFIGEPPEMAAFGNEDINGHQFQFDNNIVPFNNQDSFEGSVKVDYDLGWADLTGWGLYSDIQNQLGADGTSGAFGFFFTEQQCIDTTNALGFYPVAPPQLIVPQDAFGPGTGGPSGSLYGAYTPTACDGTQYQERNQTDYSFEVRLASKGDERLRWLGGLYYLNIDREVGVNTGLDRGFGVLATLYTTDPRNPTEQLARDNFTTDVYAVFGQLAYDLTDTIETSLALRYDREERKVHNQVPVDATTQYINTCDATAPPGTGGAYINPGLCFDGSIPDQSETFDELEPKLSITWDATDSIMAYATAGVGFKSGGFNNSGSAVTVNNFINNPLLGPGAPFEGQYAPVLLGGCASLTVCDDTYKKETSWAYELGTKTQWLDNRLRAEAAVYYVQVDDMQFFEFFVGGFGLLRVVENIDKVDIWGGELSLNYAATDWLTLYAGANFNNSEIKENNVRPDSEGNKSPYTPDNTWSTGAQVMYPVSGDYDFVGSVDISGVGETWFHVIQDDDRPTIFTLNIPTLGPGNSAPSKRDAYSLVNLRAGISGDRWSLVGFVRNAFDEEFIEEAIPAPEFGGAFISPGTERRAGVEATLKF
jgi:iron complex outermembrane receptor protein